MSLLSTSPPISKSMKFTIGQTVHGYDRPLPPPQTPPPPSPGTLSFIEEVMARSDGAFEVEEEDEEDELTIVEEEEEQVGGEELPMQWKKLTEEEFERYHDPLRSPFLTMTQFIQFIGLGYSPMWELFYPPVTPNPVLESILQHGKTREPRALQFLCQVMNNRGGLCPTCMNNKDRPLTWFDDKHYHIMGTIDGWACWGEFPDAVVEIKCPWGGNLTKSSFNLQNPYQFYMERHFGGGGEGRKRTCTDRLFRAYVQIQLYLYFTGIPHGYLLFYYEDEITPIMRPNDLSVIEKLGVLYTVVLDLIFVEEVLQPQHCSQYYHKVVKPHALRILKENTTTGREKFKHLFLGGITFDKTFHKRLEDGVYEGTLDEISVYSTVFHGRPEYKATTGEYFGTYAAKNQWVFRGIKQIQLLLKSVGDTKGSKFSVLDPAQEQKRVQIAWARTLHQQHLHKGIVISRKLESKKEQHLLYPFEEGCVDQWLP